MDNNKTPHQRNMEPPTQFYRDRFSKEKLADKLDEELEATDVIPIWRFNREKKLWESVEKRKITRWGIRQKARQDAHELRGDYPAKKVESTHEVEGVIVHEIGLVKKPKESGK